MSKLNTSHLVLKLVAVNGKMAHRWVDPATGKEHAPHGSKISFEHHGKQMTGTVGTVIKSGEYAVKGDNGVTYNKHRHQFDVVDKSSGGTDYDTDKWNYVGHKEEVDKWSKNVGKSYDMF